MFGFTNSLEDLKVVEEWRKAALADGWEATPTYNSESIDSATSLNFEGFKALIITRTLEKSKWKYQASISLWDKKGLAIEPPKVYNKELLFLNLKKCSFCNEFSSEVHRVGFANRSCPNCLEKAKTQLEYPNWTE